jgi:AbrB family looped-hinge helix DNA binding protein
VITVKVSKGFTIVIPDELRDKLGIQPETTLLVSVSNGALTLRPRHSEVQRHLGVFARRKPGGSA